MSYNNISIKGSEGSQDLGRLLESIASPKEGSLNLLINYISAAQGGARKATIEIDANAIQATGDFTLSTCVATDTAVINGVSFECVNSGATGNQFNKGATDGLSAAALAAKINASATALVSGYVTATSASGVSDGTVTVTAVRAGKAPNGFTTTATGGISAGAARLTGGTDGTAQVIYCGGDSA
jgi:hypothetical protein